jgi:hypothetical protein
MRLPVPSFLAVAAGVVLAGPAFADDFVAKLDAVYLEREARDADNAATIEQALQAAPESYAVLWRAARWHCWRVESVSGEEAKVEGETCWNLAKRAIAVQPGGVEGQYYAASGVGQYASHIGILKAISMGIEGVFNGYCDKAVQIDGAFLNGAPYLMKGRYWHELPWPKRDYGKSAEMLRKALAVQPQNVRAQIYLADTLVDDGDVAGAKAVIDAAAAHKPGVYDAPEERRALKQLDKVKAKIDAKLK